MAASPADSNVEHQLVVQTSVMSQDKVSDEQAVNPFVVAGAAAAAGLLGAGSIALSFFFLNVWAVPIAIIVTLFVAMAGAPFMKSSAQRRAQVGGTAAAGFITGAITGALGGYGLAFVSLPLVFRGYIGSLGLLYAYTLSAVGLLSGAAAGAGLAAFAGQVFLPFEE